MEYLTPFRAETACVALLFSSQAEGALCGHQGADDEVELLYQPGSVELPS